MARPKKEGKKNIRKDISMDPEQYERLIDYCRQQDRPISWVIRQALDIIYLCNGTYYYTIKLKFRKGDWLMKLSKLTKPELEEIFRNANFTEEEEKVFWDLSKGISQKEISFRHSVSITTVERRVRSIKNKLKRLEGDRFGTF